MLCRADRRSSLLTKDHIEIRCPHCGERMLTDWPTARGRRAQATCAKCGKEFPLGPAVERTVAGVPDRRDLHGVEKIKKDENGSA
jgi:DNA-directed RNA polymerase subunit RPC12/RpoP